MQTIYPCLWFDGVAQEAAAYYCNIFPAAKITSQNSLVTTWSIGESKFMGLNGGSQFRFNESVSFVITCANQMEIDRYWDYLTADGGSEGRCGWCKDKYGLSWQIIPKDLGSLMSKSAQASAAFIKMNKIVIEVLEQA